MQELEAIDKASEDRPTTVAVLECNFHKNRYSNFLPCALELFDSFCFRALHSVALVR